MNANTTLDRITYTRPFAEKVGGKIYARFRLGPDGAPLYWADDDGVRNYTIDCYLYTPKADDIFQVKYIMNDPTYYDPIGYSDDKANDFHEIIDSYGEVPVIVRVQLGGKTYEQRTWLSNMLENGHAKDMTPALEDAIQRIKSN